MQRRKLETAAASYAYLRGLVFIPLGLLFILAALANWEVGPLRYVWAFPVAAVLVGVACLPITHYYKEHYGRVSLSTRQHLRSAVAVLIGLAVMIGGSSLLRSEAPWSLDLPVNAIAVAFALIMLISYAIGIGLKRHHVIIWGALLVAGALPVWTGADPGNIGFLLAGVALMANGVFDHRLLVRTFGSSKGLNLQDSDAGA